VLDREVGSVTEFKQPEICFEVIIASTDRIIEAVVADDADIGIALNALRRQGIACTLMPMFAVARDVTAKTLIA
jgi:DNA-binding transcriptional LysR family regulator